MFLSPQITPSEKDASIRVSKGVSIMGLPIILPCLGVPKTKLVCQVHQRYINSPTFKTRTSNAFLADWLSIAVQMESGSTVEYLSSTKRLYFTPIGKATTKKFSEELKK